MSLSAKQIVLTTRRNSTEKRYATVGANDVLYVPAGAWVMDRVHAKHDVFGLKISVLPVAPSSQTQRLFMKMVHQHKAVEHGKDMSVMQCVARIMAPLNPEAKNAAQDQAAQTAEQKKAKEDAAKNAPLAANETERPKDDAEKTDDAHKVSPEESETAG